jgi:hypothetical protein
MDGDHEIDPKLEALLKQELAGARDSEERTMDGLALRLRNEKGGSNTRAPKKQTAWWPGYLAAAVMLALAVGLLALLKFSQHGALPPNPGKTGTALAGQGSDPNGNQPAPPKPVPPTPPAPTDADIPALIADLQSNQPDTAIVASDKLLKLGLSAKLALMKENRKDPAKPIEVISQLIAAIEKQEAAEVTQAVVDLEQPTDKALYIAPNKNIFELQQRKVTFEFVDTSVSEALAFVQSITGIHIALDPKFKNEALPNINLRVTDMPCDRALDWIGKLSNMEAVARGNVIVLTTPERAARLSLQQTVHHLPLRAGEPAWKQDETEAFCGLLGRLQAKATAPGEITALVPASEQARIETLIKSFSADGGRPTGPPDWTQDTDKKLSRRVTFEFVDQSLEDAINFLNSLTKVNIIMNPQIAAKGLNKTPITLKVQELPLNDALAYICVNSGLACTYRNQAIYIAPAPQNVEGTLCVFDLKPALKQGIGLYDLENVLKFKLAFAANPEGMSPPRVIRSMWCATVDPWTAERINTVLDEAAKTGKIPELPPEPWFFKTLKKMDPAQIQPPKSQIPTIVKDPDKPNNKDGF